MNFVIFLLYKILFINFGYKSIDFSINVKETYLHASVNLVIVRITNHTSREILYCQTCFRLRQTKLLLSIVSSIYSTTALLLSPINILIQKKAPLGDIQVTSRT